MKRMYSIPSVFLSWRWHFASRHCMHPLHTAYTGIHLVPTWVNFIPVLPLFPIKPPKTNQNPPCLVLKCFCPSWLCWVGVFSKYMDRCSIVASSRFLRIQYLFCCSDWLFSFPLMLGGETPAWRLTISCVCIGAKASKYECGSTCLCVFQSRADLTRCCSHLSVSLYFCVLSIFDSKASFQVMAKSQPFGFQPRLSGYPFTSLSDELSYSLLQWRELTSQAPVWNRVLRCAESVKGLDIC